MSARLAVEHFIGPVQKSFGAPPAADPEAFFAMLADEMAHLTTYQLQAGARSVIRERSVRSFPTVAECLAACSRWPDQEPEKSCQPSKIEVEEASHNERKKNTLALLRGNLEMAKRASKEGWLGQLFDYAMGSGYLPPIEAATRLSTEARRVQEDLKSVGGSIGTDLMVAYRNRYRRIQADLGLRSDGGAA